MSVYALKHLLVLGFEALIKQPLVALLQRHAKHTRTHTGFESRQCKGKSVSFQLEINKPHEWKPPKPQHFSQ